METNNHKIQTRLYFLFAAIFALMSMSKMYSQTISGQTNVTVGSTELYELSSPIQNAFWSVPAAATILSSNDNNANIRWDNPGSGYSIFVSGNGGSAQLNGITVTGGSLPLAPGNPTIVPGSETCGTATLQRSGNPSDGATWYWQGKSSSGQSQSKPASQPYLVNAGTGGTGTYYIRAYKNGQWSSGSGSRSVTIYLPPSTPVAPDKPVCGSTVTLTASGGGTGVLYRWYSPQGEIGTGSSLTIPSPTVSTSYQVRSERGNCYSTLVAMEATVLDIIPNGEATNSCANPGSATIGAYSGSFDALDPAVKHRYYTAQTGGNFLGEGTPVNAAGYRSTFTVNQAGDYWVSVKFGNCESPRELTVATFAPNTTPTMNIVDITPDDCGLPAELNLRANANSGTVEDVKWFDAQGGLLFSGAAFDTTINTNVVTYTITATLRNALGCTFPASESYTVTINPVPGEPTLTNPAPKYCPGSFILTANPGTNATSVRWYTNATGGSPLTPNANGSYTTPVISIPTSYYAESYNANTGCKSDSRTEIQAVVYAGAIPLSVPEDPVTNTCTTSEIVLQAYSSAIDPNIDPSEFEHRWYDQETGGNLIESTPPDLTGASYISQVIVSQSIDYWVSAYANGCGESPRQKISAVFEPNTVPTFDLFNYSEFQCGLTTELTLRAIGGSFGSTYEWYDDPSHTNLLYEGSDYNPVVNYNDISNGQITYYVKGTLTNSIGCTHIVYDQLIVNIQPPVTVNSTWYPDQDGDGSGDSTAIPRYLCNEPTDMPFAYVNNNDDICPEVAGPLASFGCPSEYIDENRNTITSTVYDIDDIIRASSKSYFDEIGKLQQSQSWDLASDSIWASEIRYEEFGRSALQTLSAPIRKGLLYEYKEDFVKSSSGTTYQLSDFDGANAETPIAVDEEVNTLGWYYSEDNDHEEYQDATDYPFIKSVYSNLNPGGVLRSIGGNKINGEWPQSYTFSMKASQELAQTPAFGETKYNNIEITKTIARDVHGVENIVFTDTDGKLLAAARSGNAGTTSPNMSVTIPKQGFVDVHIAEGITGFTVSNTSAVSVYDLITENEISASTGTLGKGFYRIAVNNLDTYVPESISVMYKVNYYDYRLSEYDEANRLAKTYQPLGLTKETKIQNTYEYNTIGQLLLTTSSDEGDARFKYRKDGQIRFSQNSKQLDPNEDGNISDAEFSYTNYDTYGRPVESGVYFGNTITFANSDNLLENIVDDITVDNDGLSNATCREQAFTLYDEKETAGMHAALSDANIPTIHYPSQGFISSNVSKTYNVGTDASTTWYSYDVYGRVAFMIQDISGIGAKTLDYEYDPITGQVLKIYYQKHKLSERFIHRYTYNAANELVTAETSTDDSNFSLHAEYEYYETGAMKRTELAGGVQGIDYVYNLAGQLKSLNHPSLQGSNDPGGDTNDLFGMQIDYNSDDYKRSKPNIVAQTYGSDNLNGNIKGVRWKNDAIPGVTSELMYSFQYDRNNWLLDADFGGDGTVDDDTDSDVVSTDVILDGASLTLEGTNSVILTEGFLAQEGSDVLVRIVSGSGGTPILDGDYDVSNLSYDANGNILNLARNKNSSGGNNAMDELSYNYKSGTNQLLQVVDADGNVTGADDIGSQTDASNYRYNAIGQLVENKSENITYDYDASGLVTHIRKNGLSVVKFFYNDRNHRVRKDSYLQDGVTVGQITHYVRDVAGSIMAIYTNGILSEQPIYGSGRLGVFYPQGSTPVTVYELTDHLGNVRAAFTKTTSGGTNIRTASDYYPFGMKMPGRDLVGDYRYAFQGQEKDIETGKEAFELRLWDSRIGRWLTTDPAGQYSSPYLGMGNNPINGADSDGAFWEELGNWYNGDGWNSNAALEYQANGGDLGEWVGNKFSGYRSAGSTIKGEFVGTAFKAVNDFKSGLFSNADIFGFNGRVAIGSAGKISGDIESSWAKFGIGGSVGISSMMFIGGDYGFYWYDYASYEIGPNGGVSVAAGLANLSLTGETEVVVSIYLGNDIPTPHSYAGLAGSLDANLKADVFLGADLGAGVTYGGGWASFNVTLGIGLNSTPEASVAVSARIINSVLLSPNVKPTTERSWVDLISNHLLPAGTRAISPFNK